MRTKWRTFKPLCPLVAELDEGERNGVEEEHRAYDAADGPSQKPQRLSFIHRKHPFRVGGW